MINLPETKAKCYDLLHQWNLKGFSYVLLKNIL